MTTDICSFEGCPDPIQSKGLCMGHYMQQRAGKPLTTKRKYATRDPWTECIVGGCHRVRSSGDLCTNHAATRRKFNIPADDLVALLSGAVCAACGSDEDIQVDHNHDCCPSAVSTCGGCVRGVLCRRCNTTLGWAQDDAARLRALADYIEVSRA